MRVLVERQKSQLAFAPYLEIHVGGSRLPSDIAKKVNGVDVEDDEKEADQATIFFDTLSVSDIEKFAKGTDVTIIGGYANDHRTLFVGKIEKLDVQFPQTGPISVSVTCNDETVEVGKKEKKKIFKKKKHSEIVKEVAGEHGWDADVEDTGKKHEQVSQDGLSDMQFIRRMADENGYETWLEHTKGKPKLHFKKRPEKVSSGITLTYRGDDYRLLSFSPSETDQEKSEVSDSGVDPKDKKKIETKKEKAEAQVAV